MEALEPVFLPAVGVVFCSYFTIGSTKRACVM